MYLTNKTMKLINPIHLHSGDISRERVIKGIYKNEYRAPEWDICAHHTHGSKWL